MKQRITPWGIKVKKRLIDLNMSQVAFCKKYGIPENRFSEMITGLKPNYKHKKVVNKILKIDEIA
jgi:predicted transcriptional regulator